MLVAWVRKLILSFSVPAWCIRYLLNHSREKTNTRPSLFMTAVVKVSWMEYCVGLEQHNCEEARLSCALVSLLQLQNEAKGWTASSPNPPHPAGWCPTSSHSWMVLSGIPGFGHFSWSMGHFSSLNPDVDTEHVQFIVQSLYTDKQDANKTSTWLGC